MNQILLIDDDGGVRMSLAATLRRAGFDVMTAADGREGVALFRTHPIDLVITDLIMPTQDGFETIKTVRRLQPSCKIIAISGGDQAIAERYLKVVAERKDVARILTKPFTGSEFLEVVSEVLCGSLLSPGSSVSSEDPL